MPHIGSRVFGASEIEEELRTEALIHSLAGWHVVRDGMTLACRKRGVLRVIQVRETSPMDDAV